MLHSTAGTASSTGSTACSRGARPKLPPAKRSEMSKSRRSECQLNLLLAVTNASAQRLPTQQSAASNSKCKPSNAANADAALSWPMQHSAQRMPALC